jgi:hypothetical protein
LTIGYWVVAAAILFGLVFWSPQPLIDRVEAADPSPVSRDVVDFFEHTPRVEILLAREASRGYSVAEQARDRVRYGVSHLLLLLALVVYLLLVAAAAWVEPDPPTTGSRVVEPRNVGITMVMLAVLVLALFLAMYTGMSTTSRHSDAPSDGISVFLLPAQLLLMILTLYAVERLKRRNGADSVVTRS